MTTARSLEATQSSVASSRLEGERCLRLAADRAERDGPGFCERAQLFVLAYLGQHGRASSEDITDACKDAGIVPQEDRAFGQVYASLNRRKQIVCVGFCERRKGHGTAGGRVWELA